MPNQTYADGSGPAAAKESGDSEYVSSPVSLLMTATLTFRSIRFSYGGELSWVDYSFFVLSSLLILIIACACKQLPGQKASACTCPGEDHPGPNVKTGRGAPESEFHSPPFFAHSTICLFTNVANIVDIIEAQVDYRGTGSASQSIQVAPIDAGYNWLNNTPDTIVRHFCSHLPVFFRD
jgi:hypothetical protein